MHVHSELADAALDRVTSYIRFRELPLRDGEQRFTGPCGEPVNGHAVDKTGEHTKAIPRNDAPTGEIHMIVCNRSRHRETNAAYIVPRVSASQQLVPPPALPGGSSRTRPGPSAPGPHQC